jgi:hypothetical protein
MERLARFEIPLWTEFYNIEYDDGALQSIEVTRNQVAGSAIYRVPQEGQTANRYVIGRNKYGIHFNGLNGEDHAYIMNDNYTFDDVGLYSEFEKSPVYEEFLECRKKELAIEKLSGREIPSLAKEEYEESNKLGVWLVGQDGNAVPTITHKERKQRGMNGLWNFMEDLYYPVMENGVLKMKQLDYRQQIYFCTGKSFASYINLPEGMCYIIHNSNAYHENGYVLKEHGNKTAFFNNGEFVDNNNEHATVEELTKEFEHELKEAALNCDSVESRPDITSDKVEKYIDKK